MTLTRNKQIILLIGIILAATVTAINLTMAVSSLPEIQKAFNTSLLQLKWFISLYLIAQSALMANMARIGVIFGVRRVLYFGIIGFIIVSIIAGMSNSMHTLLVCRFLMGSLSTIAYTLPVAIILSVIPNEDEAKQKVNLLQSMVGIGLAFGGFFGGIISAYLGWRWIFWINVPFLSVSLLCCAFSLPQIKSSSPNKDKPDWLGAVILAISVTTLLFALIEVSRISWISPIIFMPFLISIVFFTIFVLWEKKTSCPIIKLSLFYNRQFLSGLLCSISLSFFYSGTFFITPIYLAFFCHYSSSEIGFILLSLSLSIIFFTYIQINLMKHVSLKSLLLLSQILFVLTFSFFALTNHTANIYYLVFALVIMGAAWAFTLAPAMIAAVSTVSPKQQTSAIGILWTSHGIGGALGVSLVMILFHHNFKDHIYNQLTKIVHIASNQTWIQKVVENPHDSVQIIHANTGVPMHDIVTIFRDSFSFGFTSIFILNILISILTFIAICFLYQTNKNK